ncbi:MAG: type II secretion system protein GspG [Kiritimatiellae bacterium]|nr:type II secretion system protein GspG [Kiritimatiellia bacterium]MDD3584918.1 type II secretion system protein GspG [Kiritimatiellia bacterium]
MAENTKCLMSNYDPGNLEIIDAEFTPEFLKISPSALAMDTVLSASKRYYRDCGKWPDLGEGLASLVQEDHVEGWNGPYIPHRLLSDGFLCDSWGNQYRILMTQTRLSLVSAGHDGMFETSDDIVGSVTLESGTVIEANVKGLTQNEKFVFPSSQEELSCRN